jgi:hypothetical protein
MAIKRFSTIEYINSNVFPSQGKNKVYVFKMLVDGPESSVNLVKCIVAKRRSRESMIHI